MPIASGIPVLEARAQQALVVGFPRDREAACLPVPAEVYQLAQAADSLPVLVADYQQGREVACLLAPAVGFQRVLAAVCPPALEVGSRPVPAAGFRMVQEIIGGA